MPDTPLTDPLLRAALHVRENAHAPYSKFLVGAAIEDFSGRVYAGCNVENASYGLTVCAERAAVVRAVSEGTRKFRRLAVAADTDPLTPPCGACRQVLAEFCDDLEILLMNPNGKTECVHLKDLLPRAFHGSLL
jgi:cytidine deaminase